MLLQLAVGLIVAYGGIVGMMYLAQRSLMYLPDLARVSPAAAGLPQAEEVTLTTADSERLVAWHVAPQSDQAGHSLSSGERRSAAPPRPPFRPARARRVRRHCRVLPWFRRLDRIAERDGTSARRRRGVCVLHGSLRRRANSGVGRIARYRRRGGAGEFGPDDRKCISQVRKQSMETDEYLVVGEFTFLADALVHSRVLHLRSSLSFTHAVFASRLFHVVHHRGFWPKQHMVVWSLHLHGRLRRAFLHLSYDTTPHQRLHGTMQGLVSGGSCLSWENRRRE